GWDLTTEQGTITTDHVVNAGGLWAKQLGLMAGVDLPVTPMEHHYLVTEAIPEVAARETEMAMIVDLEGFTYFRQEGQGCLLGVYELNPKHWHVDGAPWDYGMDLIPEDIDRIAPELEKGFDRFPALQDAGIKRWVNGAFTFTPDGNPLVGPVPGLSNYWTACGVMAGFSQGGGVGKTVAEWIIEGEPEGDVFAMDVGRYGPWASNRTYLKETTRQFYSRRFVLTYPNEQLPAGRPLRLPPSHDALTAAGARWGESWGLEIPLYFAPDKDFVETPTQKRSNAHEIAARESVAVRENVGILDTSGFARYRVEGPDAAAWLDKLLANKLPTPGRIRLSPMLTHKGRLAGDLTVFNWGDHFELMGSYYLRAWHMRWFADQRGDSDVQSTSQPPHLR
ncbi:MAG: FAD-dependent oxidoreductase, partial [Pseudomonadota bacterium]